MPALFDDTARLERYDRLRRKKKICEKVFDLGLWAIVIAGMLGMFVQVRSSGGFIGELFGMIFTIAAYAAGVLALYMKRWKITLGILIAAILLTVMGVFGTGILIMLMLVILPFDFIWEKLEQEEGFPLFEISIHEQNKEMHRYIGQMEHRAVESGARVMQNDAPDNRMHDLLDAGSDPESLPAALHGYHDRTQGAVPQVIAKEAHSTTMDTLEEIGGSSSNQSY